MRCQKLRSLLPAYCNSELESSTLVTIERHFHTCSSCRQDLSAHRLVCGQVRSLKKSASAITSMEHLNSHITSSKEAPVRTMYRVSEDFNARLLNRIAHERYAQVRAQAYLPKKAPLFGWMRIAQAAVSVAVLAFVAVGLVSDKSNDSLQSSSGASKALVSAPAQVESPVIKFQDPPLGERLGLNEKYMTAQPINNPVFAGASRPAVSKSSTGSSGSALVASQSRAFPRWQFTQQLERARRIMEISNSLGMGHAYFEVIQYQTSHSSGVMIVRVNPYYNVSRQRQPQIILRPNPLRESDGRTPAGRLVGGSF